MRAAPPKLYFRYLARRTISGVVGLLGIIAALIVTVGLIEALREVAKVDAGFPVALELTLLRAPRQLLLVSPFVFLFGTLYAFGQMARSSEVAVMRAAGLSIWRVVAAPAALALGCGVLVVLALDPLGARMETGAQNLKNEMRGREGQMLAEFRDGIWLRQDDGQVSTLVRADAYAPDTATLTGLTLWRRTLDGVFLDRLDAERARVTDAGFVLSGTRRTTAGRGTEDLPDGYAFPVALDLRALREDQAKPDALPVWRLRETARVMGSAGLRTSSYELRYHDLWSLPVRLAAMTLIACAFAIGTGGRGGGTARLMGFGVGAGFALFILAELSSAIAEAALVPIALAAWTPAVLAVLFAVSLLLYREDG